MNLDNLKDAYERHTILFIVAITFFVYLIIAPLFAHPPGLPHDFYAYVGGANCLLEGGDVYSVFTNPAQSPSYEWDVGTSICWGLYGPLLYILNAAWIFLFGRSFFILKILNILFACGSVWITYRIISGLYGKKSAEYGAILLAFSYPLLEYSAVLAQDEIFFMFFVLASVHLLFREQFVGSGVLFGVALLFKAIPIIFLPPLLWFVYKRYDLKKLAAFVLSSAITWGLVTLPFFLRAGFNSMYPYTNIPGIAFILSKAGVSFAVSDIYTDFIAFSSALNAARVILSGAGVMIGADPGAVIGLLPSFSRLATLIVIVLLLRYTIRAPLTKPQLLASMFLWVTAVTLPSNFVTADYFYWGTPFLIVLFSKGMHFELSAKRSAALLLIVSGMLIYSVHYLEIYTISTFSRLAILFTIPVVLAGSHLLMGENPIRKYWNSLVLGMIGYGTLQARIFNPAIPILDRILPASLKGIDLTYLGTTSASFSENLLFFGHEIANTTLLYAGAIGFIYIILSKGVDEGKGVEDGVKQK